MPLVLPGTTTDRAFKSVRLKASTLLTSGVALPARPHDLPGPAVGGAKRAAVGRLSPAAGVEDRAIEEDQGALALGRGRLHRTQASLDAPGVRVDVADVVAHGRTLPRPRPRYLTVSVPVMLGWTEQTKLYVPAGSAGTS